MAWVILSGWNGSNGCAGNCPVSLWQATVIVGSACPIACVRAGAAKQLIEM